jgi:hypothetical protein
MIQKQITTSMKNANPKLEEMKKPNHMKRKLKMV